MSQIRERIDSCIAVTVKMWTCPRAAVLSDACGAFDSIRLSSDCMTRVAAFQWRFRLMRGLRLEFIDIRSKIGWAKWGNRDTWLTYVLMSCILV